MADRGWQALAGAGIALCAAAFVCLILFVFYVAGFAVGFWPAACGIDSTQPHCVKAGWGQHNDVSVHRGQGK